MAASKGPRYAPADPTLPKPWRALIDDKSGYLYFWNPETNVTQYQKPTAPPAPKSEFKPKSEAEEEADDGNNHHQRPHIHNGDDMDSRIPHHQVASAIVGQEPHIVHDSGNDVQISKGPARELGKSDVGSRSSAEAYRRQHEITVAGDVPHPFTTFESTGFPSEILREVLRAGFSAPTPIQAQSWPISLQNRDIVAVAKTGSGKTLAYLIPGFIHLKRLQGDSKIGPRVLVLSPTRELATQIHDEAEKFGRSSRISSVCLYGGTPKGPQLRDLARGADVVIATPGRLNDILEMRRVSLHQVSYMVLDEADRMLDMGFEPQIRKIVKEIPTRRQTLMFTATWPKEIRKIAADLLVNPVQVNIGNIDELVANKSITQYVEVIAKMEKERRLQHILRSQEPGSKIIIFCATKRMCDQLSSKLTSQFGAAAIHGDKSQSERDSILAQFRSGSSPVLVATDVAARGLDIKDIRVVINYDFPTGVEDYVHRIGRTGRAGATGVAYTFFCDQDSKYASDLVKILEGADQRVPSELRDMMSYGGYGGKSRRWSSGSSAHDEHGCSSYGGDGYGASSDSGQLDTSYGRGGYSDYKSTSSRYDEGPVWSHDRIMAAAAEGGGKGGLWASGGNRSRSRSPVGGW